MKNAICLIIFGTSLAVLAANNAAPSAIETFIIDPIEMETAEIWVPLAKAGPFINEGCDPQLNCVFTFAAHPKADHTKDPNCHPGLARTLAEYTSAASAADLPLTIFNNWQWECLYALGRRQTAAYDLIDEGGSWECSWEARAHLVRSRISLTSLRISDDGSILSSTRMPAQSSDIELTTFSDIRTRDGYPKEKKL